jgi:hypothetical protein
MLDGRTFGYRHGLFAAFSYPHGGGVAMSRVPTEARYLFAERWMVKQVGDKKEADFSARGRFAEVRAEAVRDLCLGPSDDVDRVALRHATVKGRLQLEGSHVKRRLSFVDCQFPKGVSLSQARSEHPIEFVRCQIADVEAIQLEARGDIVLRNCTTRATFAGAQIGDGTVVGDLILSGSHLLQFGQVALDARNLLVTGSLLLDSGFRADGKVFLESANIGRDLDCRGGHVANPGHNAIEASHLIVTGEIVCERGFTAHGEIVLSWAQATAMRFRGATLTNPDGVALRADGVFVKNGVYLAQEFKAFGSVHLVGAHIEGELSCTGGRFENRAGHAIEAERITAADVYLDRGFTAIGSVRVTGAQLSRQLTCTGGSFTNEAGAALDAAGIVCGGGIFLDRRHHQNAGFTAHGEVNLAGATVGTELTCTGGFFDCPTGVALRADGLTTAGNVNLDNGFRAIGEVRLARATVGRQLLCTGASFDGPGELALDLTGVVVNGDVELSNGCQIAGELRLSGAHVVRNVNFTEGRLSRLGGPALSAHKLNAGSSIMWRLSEAPGGRVDFSFANTNTLNDDRKSWPPSPPKRGTCKDNDVVLEGFQFRTLDSSITFEDRMELLNNTSIYSMQQYRELARAYRLAGEHKNYRMTMIEGFKNERLRGNLKWYSYAWNWFLQWTVGYGYNLWLPFVYVLVIGFVMGFFFHYAEHNPQPHMSNPHLQPIMVPVQREVHSSITPIPCTSILPNGSPSPCESFVYKLNPDFTNGRLTGDYPSFNAWTYSYGLLIPVANLQQISYWLPSGKGLLGKFLLYYTWVAVTFGWLLALAVANGIGNILRRD